MVNLWSFKVSAEGENTSQHALGSTWLFLTAEWGQKISCEQQEAALEGPTLMCKHHCGYGVYVHASLVG